MTTRAVRPRSCSLGARPIRKPEALSWEYHYHRHIPLCRDVWVNHILSQLALSEWHVLASVSFGLRELVDGHLRDGYRSSIRKRAKEDTIENAMDPVMLDICKIERARDTYQVAQFPLGVLFYVWPRRGTLPFKAFIFQVFRHLRTPLRAAWYGAETLRNLIFYAQHDAATHGFRELCMETKETQSQVALFNAIAWLEKEQALPGFRLDAPCLKHRIPVQTLSLSEDAFSAIPAYSASVAGSAMLYRTLVVHIPWTAEMPEDYFTDAECTSNISNPKLWNFIALAMVSGEEDYIRKQREQQLACPKDEASVHLNATVFFGLVREESSTDVLLTALPFALVMGISCFRACFEALRSWYAFDDMTMQWGTLWQAVGILLPAWITHKRMYDASYSIYWTRDRKRELDILAQVLNDKEMASFAKGFARTLYESRLGRLHTEHMSEIANAVTHWLSCSTPAVRAIFVAEFWQTDDPISAVRKKGHAGLRTCEGDGTRLCVFHCIQHAVEKAGIVLLDSYYRNGNAGDSFEMPVASVARTRAGFTGDYAATAEMFHGVVFPNRGRRAGAFPAAVTDGSNDKDKEAEEAAEEEEEEEE